ncbi:hypothetical protein ACIBCP_27130 [Streptomyces sp. NPDC051287]|uniref:hypothetical protein n=1 Tax=Streptomyces sp. NPDC051287 TaxID=3365648 RepID=UPI00378AB236
MDYLRQVVNYITSARDGEIIHWIRGSPFEMLLSAVEFPNPLTVRGLISTLDERLEITIQHLGDNLMA